MIGAAVVVCCNIVFMKGGNFARGKDDVVRDGRTTPWSIKSPVGVTGDKIWVRSNSHGSFVEEFA